MESASVHTFRSFDGDEYWDRQLDANSRHKVAEAVLTAVSENVECPACHGAMVHDYIGGEPPDYEGWHYERVGDQWIPAFCSFCRGEGSVWIVRKQEP